MLTKRRLEIFKCIVDEFIQTAEPVGSKTIMEKYNLPYSSATIRNDMMYLEDIGYLEKTHTSSGRVPSTKGYRFYVEHLMQTHIDERVEYAVANIFDRKSNIDEAIKESCEILSQMTNLASGVLGPDASNQLLEHIKLFPLDSKKAVCVFITDCGHTENRTFDFHTEVSLEDIQSCCEILNDRLKGTRIIDLVEKMQSLKPILAQSVKRHEVLFNAFLKAFIKFASDNVYFAGTNNMLYQPEFSDIEKLRSLMKMLGDSSLWRQIDSPSNELMIKTSSGSSLVWMDDVAVVTSRFRLNDAEEGKLMVVGPSRMDYDRIVGLLEYISDSIERLYRNGAKDD